MLDSYFELVRTFDWLHFNEQIGPNQFTLFFCILYHFQRKNYKSLYLAVTFFLIWHWSVILKYEKIEKKHFQMKNLIANRHSLPTWKCAGQISLQDMKIKTFVLWKVNDPFLSHLCRRKPWFMLIAYQNMALKFPAPFFTKLHNLVAEAAFSREIRLESSARQKGGWGSAFNAVKEGHVTNYGAHWWTYLKIYNFNQQSTKSSDCTTLIFGYF